VTTIFTYLRKLSEVHTTCSTSWDWWRGQNCIW